VTQAYSYIRFSSERQKLGDSLRRQLKAAEEYAAKHGLTLDTQSYRDLGVSAYRGKNAIEGKLGTFLTAVDTGKIAKGSYLLVESLDRISRAQVDEALELLLSIVRRGIKIVTLTDGQVYSRERIKEDKGISLIVSISILIRAHEESSTKAERIAAKWSVKRTEAAAGRIMTAMAPAWLKPNKDRTSWIVDQVKAKVVQRIFELALAGNGTPTIARRFNEESVPTMKRAHSWTFGVVNAILKNPAVIGTYASKRADASSIEGYYPAIVDEAKYYRVREMLLKRMWVGGRSGERVANLFAGISFCEACGERMRMKSTKGTGAGRLSYLQCLSAYSNSGCAEKTFPYYAAERAILRHLADDLSTMLGRLQSEPALDPRVELEVKREDLRNRIGNLVSMLETAASPQVASRIKDLQQEVDRLEGQIRDAVDPAQSIVGIREAAELFDKMKGFGDALDVEERRQVQTALRRIVKAVYFMSDRGDGRPTVAVTYSDQLTWGSTFLDVRPFMEKVGGDRRPRMRVLAESKAQTTP
jgi:DNA invertase Pin-like site-specific DNA recombinase